MIFNSRLTWRRSYRYDLVETMQRLLPEKSISLMVYLHANNRSLMVEVDRDVLDSISKYWNITLDRHPHLVFDCFLWSSVKWSLRTMLQAREKTNKRFHGAIPKLLHSIKHSRSKAAPLDDELHHVRDTSTLVFRIERRFLSFSVSIWLWISIKQSSLISLRWKRTTSPMPEITFPANHCCLLHPIS